MGGLDENEEEINIALYNKLPSFFMNSIALFAISSAELFITGTYKTMNAFIFFRALQ